ncbi:MAG: hypothetical protein JXA77_18720 [Bacteroidales bacterium]|nr:hypothetical protein [Bacteroidales bacterium]MBN2818221.1 hypothetical protein [Bacteroidales bacterium]
MDLIIKRKYLVTSAEVDFEGKIRMSALINFLIQTAWQHAEHLGWGVSEIQKYNLSWVLSGIQIELNEYTNWKEEIAIETWPKGLNRLFYLRDYIIYNQKGEKIGKATSNWLLIDVDKRRPKLHKVKNIDKVITDKHAIEDLIPSLNFAGKPEKKTNYQVRYSNVDVNQHLTTTGYIDFVFDTFDPDFISKNRPRVITMNFLKEVVYGTNASMLRITDDENKKQFILEPAEGGKAFFKCELSF